MKINLTVTEEVAKGLTNPAWQKPELETVTLVTLDGEMDSATLASTLRAIAGGVQR